MAAPIEQQVNGVEGMMYMSSQCTNDGSYNLTVTFQQGVDLNMAQVLVQNRVNLAIPSLPDVIKADRRHDAQALARHPHGHRDQFAQDGRYDQLYLSNYALMQVKDELARVDGVGDVFLFGQRDYSMRIWVDPGQAGVAQPDGRRRGERPSASKTPRWPPARSASRRCPAAGISGHARARSAGCTNVEQFENIILKTGAGRAAKVRLKDVARVELGAKNQDVDVMLDGKPTVFLAIFQLPDANALDTHDRVLAKMDELKKNFPDGVDYDIGFDTTPYTRESIREGVQDAARRDHPGGDRGAAVPAELAVGDHSRWWPCRWRSSARSPRWRPSASA